MAKDVDQSVLGFEEPMTEDFAGYPTGWMYPRLVERKETTAQQSRAGRIPPPHCSPHVTVSRQFTCASIPAYRALLPSL